MDDLGEKKEKDETSESTQKIGLGKRKDDAKVCNRAERQATRGK